VSTTFDVYPRTANLPTVNELLERSTRELHAFLEAFRIVARPEIQVRLQRRADHAPVAFDLRGPLRWDRDTYAWFEVGDVAGGTDACFDSDKRAIDEGWEGELDHPRCLRLEPLIRTCVGVGHRWSFRRSAGQPAIINVAYGLIAGSLASITDGFIDSTDSAWDWERMPARPDEFLGFYFRPMLARGKDFREWSQRCIASLEDELRGTSEA